MTNAPEVHTSEHGAPSFLTAKRAGLPTWTWIAIIGAGGYVVFRYVRTRNTGTVSTTSTADATADAGTNPGTVAVANPSIGSVSPSDTDYSASGQTATDSGYASQSQWGASTAAYLESTGVSPIDAANAVSAYLSQTPVTADQSNLLNTALKAVGTPPGGIVPVTVLPAPTPTPTPTPVATTPSPVAKPTPKPKPPTIAYTSYTVKSGQDLATIAHLSYGKATTAEVNAIAKASHITATAHSKLKAGTKLRIPHTIT